jgi:hypothetical protein
MIKINVEIEIENYEEILNVRSGFFSTLLNKMISKDGDMEKKVEESVGQTVAAEICPVVKKILKSEGVKAEVHAYVEKRG